MSRSAVGNAHLPSRKDLRCPRDKAVMTETAMRDALVDICGACQGTFFDSGEMFTAAGVAADPSSWDHPETGGVVKEGSLRCPRCAEVVMQAQDVTLEGKHVEIDRCGKCGGIWLDKNELDMVVAIGHAMRPLLEAARAAAQAELGKMGAVSFRPAVPRRKILAVLAALLLVGGIGWVIAWVTTYSPAAQKENAPPPRTRAKQEEGCPCGCDRSTKMAADLRKLGGDGASRGIESALVTIGEREDVGYITERMIRHRLRLLDLADEMHLDTSSHPETRRLMGGTAQGRGPRTERCTVRAVESETLRVCAELAVHGERTEIVDGEPKLITSCFRLWLSIENLADHERTLATASIDGGGIHFPVSRWYLEDGRGQPWDGVVRAREKVRVNVIGYIPEHVEPHTPIRADIALDSLVIHATTEARAVLHAPVPSL